MKTYKKKYHQIKRTFKKRGGSGAAAAHSGERFKCPFCDKTYSAMSNIYTHCEKKHPGQPMPRLTHASTVVRGEAAVARERLESERRSGSRRLERDQFVAANGPERFKCPFCDKTFTAITNIYGHCQRKHRGIPMVRLTYDNTIVRPGAAAAAPPDAPPLRASLAPPAAAAPARPVSASAARQGRERVDSDDSDYNDDSLPGDPRFKCPYCNKTYSEMMKIYGHCNRRHRSQPWPVLTYENTVVRPAVAADAAPVSHRVAQLQRDLAQIRRDMSVSQARAAVAADAAPARPVSAAAALRLARRMLDSDDSDDDVHPALAAALAADRRQRQQQQFAALAPPAAAAAAAAPAPPPPPVVAAAVAAPVRVGRIVTRTGTLQGNSHYITNPVMIPNFQTSGSKLQRNSTYMDWIEMEDKNVLDVLKGDPNTLAFKIGGSFCVITKDELFTLMNNPDSIKYECNRICKFDEDGLGGIRQSAEKGVPYLSLGSFSQFQGLVSFFDLWYIVVSQQPQLSQAYELVDAHRPHMLSMASHNFLFGPGAAGARAVSAAHCQAGQDASTVYEIRILPIHTHSRSRAATTIQRLVRGHQTRRNR
jgi:hypothetical protein